MKEIVKNEKKGITLIALVITIVILIILAGVLINLTLGDNGIFTRSKIAKQRYEYAAAKEIIDVKLVDIQAECMTEGNEYTLEIVANKLGLSTEQEIEIMYYYESTAMTNSNANTKPNSIDGIVVIASKYPQYEFLLGEKTNGEIGITGATIAESGVPAKSAFKAVEQFEKDVIGTTVTTNNQSNKTTLKNMNEETIKAGSNISIGNYFSNADNIVAKYNGNTISSTQSLTTGTWTLMYNASKNEIEVNKLEELEYIKDLSGNSRHAYLQNHTRIKRDTEGNYFLDFDGEDDYCSIEELDENINWNDGFTIEFEAQWDSFNEYSRIFSASNGPEIDEVLVGNEDKTRKFYFDPIDSNDSTSWMSVETITKGQKDRYKVECLTTGTTIYKNGTQIANKVFSAGATPENTKRIYNYLGKSPWNSDGYLDGRIYSIKITQTDGTVILWYDINKEMENKKIISIVGEGYTGCIKDLSGNNRNAYLEKGASIAKDDQNNYYLSFDGLDDFAKILELNSSINWNDGFTIEFEAQWDSFNEYSRIFSASNGPEINEIYVANKNKTSELNFDPIDSNDSTSWISVDTITKGQKDRYKVECLTTGTTIYKNGTQIANKVFSAGATPENIKRIYNYLGKSPWNSDGYLEGRIYSIKITQNNGTVILWYDINRFVNGE